MKKFLKKTIVFAIAAIMMLAMAIPAMAADKANDTATLSITNIDPNPDTTQAEVDGKGATVTLYQIGKVVFSTDGKSVLRYEYAEGITDIVADPTAGVSEAQVQAITNGLLADPATITPYSKNVTALKGGATAFTKTIAAANDETGLYIAVITPAPGSQKIYNPILLGAGYDSTGSIKTEAISTDDPYKTNGTAKSSTPKVYKDIQDIDTGVVDGTIAADANGVKDQSDEDTDKSDAGHNAALLNTEGVKTVNIGDDIKYAVAIDIPSYPEGAIDKTMWANDTMEDCLDYNKDMKVKIGTTEYTFAELKTAGIAFDYAEDAHSWTVVFDYDKLPVKTGKIFFYYTAKLNDQAEVAPGSNDNEVTYIYSNNPNQGQTHKTTTKPTGKSEWNDKESVYTYKIQLLKTNEDGSEKLDGAHFVVKNTAGKYLKVDATTKAITWVDNKADADDFVTDTNGLTPVITGLAKGTYTFEETQAPTGYNLPSNPNTDVIAQWDTVTVTSYEKQFSIDAATAIYKEANGSAKIYGYVLKTDVVNEKFESSKIVTAIPNGANEEDYYPVYVCSELKITETKSNLDQLVPTGLAANSMKNSQTPGLPSTGGMGTYIFTIIGVAVVAIAAGMLIFRKKQA